MTSHLYLLCDLGRLLLGMSLSLQHAALVAVAAAAALLSQRLGWGFSLVSLGFHERPAAGGFAESKDNETSHDEDPVDIIGDDGTVGGGVGPTKDSVEDAPSDGTGQIGRAALRGREIQASSTFGVSVTYVYVPHALVNII